MPREIIDNLVNLSDRDSKRRLMSAIGAMSGLYDVTIKPRRATRTNAQNAWYWSCIVKSFADFLRDQGEAITDDEAHNLLKAKFLRRSIVNKETGEVIGQAIKSTTALDTAEMSDYLDRCIHWLADMFGIVVPDPNQYREAA